MFQRKDYILLGFICLTLGFFIIQQFYLHKKITKTIQPENENNLALEVSELIKTNTLLQAEIEELNSQHEKLSRSAADAKSANETIEENLKKYKIILGLGEISGEGVEIVFENKVNSTQLIDLINAIKNIGVEAMQVNNERITHSTSICGGLFNPPTIVKAIGNKNILYESLVRPGGILEQIGAGNVSKKDNIVIKA